MKLFLKLFRASNLDKIIVIADQYVFHGNLEKIIEVTYSYREIGDGNILNETLFEEYTKLVYPENNLSHLWRVCKYKLQLQVLTIEKIIKKTQRLRVCSRADSLRRGIFIDALRYVALVIENAVLGLDFELEKAGIAHNLSQAPVTEKIKEIEKREKELFWEKVIENAEEFSSCYNFILKNHLQKQEILSEQDKKSMDLYLKWIKKASPCKLIKTPSIQKKVLHWDFLEKQIQRKDYRRIFDWVCELYWLPQRTKLTNAGSIYDGDDYLEIPKNKEYASMGLDKILRLLTHEIESHYISIYNNKILLWNFRWSKNLPKEEWLAMFMEKILEWYNYENISNIVESSFTILAWECLPGKDFEDFMRIMGKEYKCKYSYTTAVIRSKRNYSLNYPWVQHKDVVYFRGLTETVKYLKEGWLFFKLFLWKVGFRDIDNIFDIYQASEKKEKCIFPIFISDLITYYLLEKEKNKDFVFHSWEYCLYLKKKYWFLDLWDFHIIPQVNDKWKKIEQVIKILEKSL